MCQVIFLRGPIWRLTTFSLLFSNGDTFDFHLCADSKSVGAERAPGRIALVKIGFVDLVSQRKQGIS